MRQIIFCVCVFIVSCLPAAAQHAVAPRPVGSDTVFVLGAVEHPLHIIRGGASPLTLKAGAEHQLRNGKGEVKKTIPAFQGYLLSEILDKAIPVMPEHKDQGQYVLVVKAVDGYTVVFSYNELAHGPAAESAWLIPVSGIEKLKNDGPFVLICASDKVSAPRYVKWVRSIELRKI